MASLSFFDIINMIPTYPALGVILSLVILVTLVSGATDAPNAIATAVSTRCIKPGRALIMAAVCNFIGLIVISFLSTSVAETMFNMVNFSSDSPQLALAALVAAMVASIGWGTFCWFLGIPASKSHSLIAGITGGAIALNGVEGVVISEWMKVIYGMVFSLVAGFVLGWILVQVVKILFGWMSRINGNRMCVIVQNVLAAILAGLHGGQDGQKFISIAIMGIALVFGNGDALSQGSDAFPMWMMFVVSAFMAIGTLIGGKKIIKTVAMDMVKLEKYQGLASSTATALTLLISTFTGMPVSTSHCNTSAIMGVGSAKNIKKVNWPVARNMVFAWVLTFPCCGFIGFVMAKVFMLF